MHEVVEHVLVDMVSNKIVQVYDILLYSNITGFGELLWMVTA